MWKKILNKPNTIATPPSEQETDAILSKIDASVHRREGERGRQAHRIQQQQFDQLSVASGNSQKTTMSENYARSRAVTDVGPGHHSTGPSPYASPHGSPRASPVYGHEVNQFIATQKQPHQLNSPQKQYLQPNSMSMEFNVNKPVPKSPKSPFSPTKSQQSSSRPPTPASKTPEPQMINNRQQANFSVFRPQKTQIQDLKLAESLSSHLFQNGFLDGAFSDTMLSILGKTYRLHRLVLCRFSFFNRLYFNSNVGENSQIEIEITDTNISSESVDIVLASMYGLVCPAVSITEPDFLAINSENVLSVLAAAIFFEHKKLVDYCVEFITSVDMSLEQYRKLAYERFPDITEVTFPTPERTILRYIDFIDGNDYGVFSEILEDALLNYLCFEGFLHLESLFVQLPLPWLERVLEADAFWCPNEFCRYQFAKSVILQRRLQNLKTEDLSQESGQRAPEEVYADIFRFAIIYTHMTFEQLNEVRSDNFVAESILMKSLWHQTRLRSTIESVSESTVTIYPENQNNQEQAGNVSVPIRIGVEFMEFTDLAEGERKYSSTFFYGGSWWSVFLQKFPAAVEEDGTERPQKWGIFLRRAEGAEIMKLAASKSTPDSSEFVATGDSYNPDKILDPLTGTDIEKSVSYYLDKRVNVRAVFKLFNPAIRSYDPIFESRPNDFTETQSWGFRSRDQVVSDDDMKLIEHGKPTVIRMSVVMKYM